MGLALTACWKSPRARPTDRTPTKSSFTIALCAGLLLIHGLHPVPLETRLREALEKVRPYMQSHGGNVELLSLDNDAARLRLLGHCKSCPSSAVTLELALKQAIEEACPDLLSFECEGVAEASADHESHTPNAAPSWIVLNDVHGLKAGRVAFHSRRRYSARALQDGRTTLRLSRPLSRLQHAASPRHTRSHLTKLPRRPLLRRAARGPRRGFREPPPRSVPVACQWRYCQSRLASRAQ